MNKSGKNTLLMSVIMSSPGPLIVGLGLLIGNSSTQLADFIRRSLELLAIILAFIVYSMTSKDDNQNTIKKEKLENLTNNFVSIMMIICGTIMLLLAIFSQNEEKGNVIPGLIIAILGVVANSIFWFRYKKLGIESNNNILILQSKLYRAKTFVDTSVMLALLVVMLSKDQNVSYYFDLVGTCVVSLYLGYTGIKNLYQNIKKRHIN